MYQDIAPKLIAVQEQLSRDPEYLALQAEYEFLNGRLLCLFESFSEEETDLIIDYLGLIGEMHRRMLIAAFR